MREIVQDTVGGGALNLNLIALNLNLIGRLREEHCRSRVDHSEKLWIVFVLRWWARRPGVAI